MLPSPPAKDIEQYPRGFTDGRARNFFQLSLVFSALAAGAYLCFRLALPFITPLVIAVVLAIILAPLHRRVEHRLKWPSMAAGLIAVAAALGILGPMIVLVAELVNDAAQGAAVLRGSIEAGFIEKTLSAHPKLSAVAAWMLARIDLQGVLGEGATRLTDFSASFLRISLVQVVSFLLTFYMLFYFLRDRRAALVSVRSFLPFTADESSILFARLADTVHAVIFGTVVTGVIQGVLGGFIFAFAGIPAPLLWGLAIGVVAILPVLGTVLVWLPAVIIVALNGEWLRAAGIATAFLAIGVLDTFIYPALVGNKLRLHTALTFIAVVGGLIVFGPAGFILGPLCIAVTLAVRDIARARIRSAYV